MGEGDPIKSRLFLTFGGGDENDSFEHRLPEGIERLKILDRGVWGQIPSLHPSFCLWLWIEQLLCLLPYLRHDDLLYLLQGQDPGIGEGDLLYLDPLAARDILEGAGRGRSRGRTAVPFHDGHRARSFELTMKVKEVLPVRVGSWIVALRLSGAAVGKEEE
jgi:hypothetical protein